MIVSCFVRCVCFLSIFVLLLSQQTCFSQQETIQKRLQFRLHDSLYTRIQSELQIPIHKAIGYTEAEMKYYNPDVFVLRTVMNAFNDIRFTHRYAGSQSTTLLQNAHSLASIVRIGFGFTDVSAGRMLPLEPDSLWGTSWADSNSSTIVAIRSILTTPMSEAYRKTWEQQYPEHIRKFVLRMYVGIEEAHKWLQPALASVEPILTATIGRNAGKNVSERRNHLQNSCYTLAAAPWNETRLGQLATTQMNSFELLHAFDRKSLAFASSILFTHIDRAIKEFKIADSLYALDSLTTKKFEGVVLYTPLGTVRVTGSENDMITSQDLLCIDLGGNDRYRGRFASSVPIDQPISVVIDLDGNDVFDGSDTIHTMGSGLFGIGCLIDLKGNDSYLSKHSAIGNALYGVGVVADFDGDDIYTGNVWTQGAAHIGVGAVVDYKGNDIYSCAEQSQAMGSTLGAGILLDIEGNDSYIARDDGNVSALYLNQSVAMSQGVGYGRRADLGDGHSLAGGVGILVDGNGDDIYSAQVWAQGAGYWWGLGILEDFGGNDKYRNGKYSAGAGAHFAVGVFTDLTGDDEYNLGNETAKNQYHGHARDGSIGIATDGAGNDKYLLKTLSGGAADLGSIGFFWDKDGDDEYTIDFEDPKDGSGWSDTPPLGSTSLYPLFHTFRDELITIGIFLDEKGEDTYNSRHSQSEIRTKNRSIWKQIRSSISKGVGIDK
ncbi:MAG: hypothetical protein JNL36_04125 [Candidatus Kapabacteria bacterium]|nr:hypothetical protein [Candidatus Kapabacteria bacterium]